MASADGSDMMLDEPPDDAVGDLSGGSTSRLLHHLTLGGNGHAARLLEDAMGKGKGNNAREGGAAADNNNNSGGDGGGEAGEESQRTYGIPRSLSDIYRISNRNRRRNKEKKKLREAKWTGNPVEG